MGITLGKAIQYRRSTLGLTQKEAAESIGIDRGTLIRYESDRAYPGVLKRGSVAKWLGVDLSELPERIAA